MKERIKENERKKNERKNNVPKDRGIKQWKDEKYENNGYIDEGRKGRIKERMKEQCTEGWRDKKGGMTKIRK